MPQIKILNIFFFIKPLSPLGLFDSEYAKDFRDLLLRQTGIQAVQEGQHCISCHYDLASLPYLHFLQLGKLR